MKKVHPLKVPAKTRRAMQARSQAARPGWFRNGMLFFSLFCCRIFRVVLHEEPLHRQNQSNKIITL